MLPPSTPPISLHLLHTHMRRLFLSLLHSPSPLLQLPALIVLTMQVPTYVREAVHKVHIDKFGEKSSFIKSGVGDLYPAASSLPSHSLVFVIEIQIGLLFNCIPNGTYTRTNCQYIFIPYPPTPQIFSHFLFFIQPPSILPAAAFNIRFIWYFSSYLFVQTFFHIVAMFINV